MLSEISLQNKVSLPFIFERRNYGEFQDRANFLLEIMALWGVGLQGSASTSE